MATAAYELYAPTDTAARIAQEELEHAATTFRRFFGAEPAPLAVVVFPSAEAMRTFDWAPLRQRRLQPLPWLVEMGDDVRRSRGGLEGSRALSHEACHLFLIAHTGRQLGRAGEQQTGVPRAYGDPVLPDWFDEGVATLCEFPTLRGQRREHLRRVADATIPFAEFFRMEHPMYAQITALLAAEQVSGRADTTGQPVGQPVVRRLRLPAGGIGGPDRERAQTFYAQAQSLAEFLAEHEGSGFIGKVGEALARGQTIEQVLATQARRLPGDLAGLEREWKAC